MLSALLDPLLPLQMSSYLERECNVSLIFVFILVLMKFTCQSVYGGNKMK